MYRIALFIAASALLAACGTVEITPDAAPSPGDDAGETASDASAPEVCTPSTAGSSPADEDLDGAIDEGCTWRAGRPHQLSQPMAGDPWSTHRVEPTRISRDGLRLSVVHQVNKTREFALVSSRAGRDKPFGAPVAVRGLDLDTYMVESIRLSSDELEAVLSARKNDAGGSFDLFRTRRASRTDPFAPLERLAAPLSTDANDEWPFLSADGRELFFSSDRRLKRAVRPSPTADFGPPEDLQGIPAGTVNGAYLSDDGRQLFYFTLEGVRYQVYRVERASLDTAVFGNPQPGWLGLTDVDAVAPVISQSTREVFFSSHREQQKWSSIYLAPWRAELCFDGACQDQQVPCPTDGALSEDKMHCYTQITQSTTYRDAEAACVQRGGHLVSIQSHAEHDVVRALAKTGTRWIGGFDHRNRPQVPECNIAGTADPFCVFAWEDGEVWTYQQWDKDNPDNGLPIVNLAAGDEDCVSLAVATGAWRDDLCERTNPAVCETTLYPTW